MLNDPVMFIGLPSVIEIIFSRYLSFLNWKRFNIGRCLRGKARNTVLPATSGTFGKSLTERTRKYNGLLYISFAKRGEDVE